MHIYTKTGDKGTTMLIGGERVAKNDSRVEAYGTVDELDAYIGLIDSMLKESADSKIPNGTIELFGEIRKALFLACAYVACCSVEVGEKMQSPDYDVITHIEKAIDDISETLPKQFSLMILGNNVISSHINVARTICRRAERRIVAIEGEIVRKDFVSQLLNRLSDYLYVLLRVMMA